MATYTGTIYDDAFYGTEFADTFNMGPNANGVGGDRVVGGGGIDTLNLDYSSVTDFIPNSIYYAAIYDFYEGGFEGNVWSCLFNGIENVAIVFSGASDWVRVYAAPLQTAGNTLSLNGGLGIDMLSISFGYLSSTTFIDDGSGSVTSNHGIYNSWESYEVYLGPGVNSVLTAAGNDYVEAIYDGTSTISTGVGDDKIFSARGVSIIDGGAGNDTWNGNYSASVGSLAFAFDGSTGAGTLSNGTTLAGIESGDIDTGSGNDTFNLTNNAVFDVHGGAGTDTLNRSDAGLTGAYVYSHFYTDGAGGFDGNIGNGSFSSIESINVTLSDDDNYAFVYAFPLASGSTLNLSGGLGFDTLQAEFTNFADTTFTVAANGAVTGNRGNYTSFEQFILILGGGTNTVTTQGGTDTIYAFNGVINTNMISTGAGADTVYGGSGNETVDGGTETDNFYVLSSRAGFSIVQDGTGGYILTDIDLADGDQGTDRLVNVEYIAFGDQTVELPAYGGGLTLTGTSGNDTLTGGLFDDTISGLGGADQLQGLYGNDLLNGGTGNDTIDGGSGIDTATYADATASVKVNLSLTAAQNTGLAGGTDRLISIENLIGSAFNDTLTGNSGDNVIEGLGGNNTLVGGAGNDTLIGGAGTDKLDGGLDVDTMTGGAGNDTYTVNDSNDVVIELLAQGTDAVNASATFTLSANVEKLTLTGATNIDGTGNELANTITGNTGNNTLSGLAGKDVLSGGLGDDILIGGLGADTLTGGAGADRFRFDVLETALNKDTVKDFVRGSDVIELSRSAFSALAGYGAGALDASELALGTKATLPGQNLVYNAATGALFYDSDGSGAQAQVQIAVFSTKPLLDAGDFVLI